MMGAVLTLLVLGAPPAFITRGDLTPAPALRAEAEAAWRELEARYVAEAGGVPARGPGTVELRRGELLAPGRSGQGWPGVVELRQGAPGALRQALGERLRVALRHELAHQLLWWACPAGAQDRLFHEAFAVAVSGELEAWRGGPYLSLGAAAAVLAREPGVDTVRARQALARLLGEGRGLPRALTRRLRRCQDGAAWGVPLAAEELAEVPVPEGLRATVVLSRHSGEVLLAEGEVRRLLPFGSTLKPFVVAASAGPPPVLAPRAGVAEWACGEGPPARVGWQEALVRSCNGYFLDWEARGGAPVGLGEWGAVLEAVGLSGQPVDMAEAIGIRATLRLSPWGLAQGYRLLAEARPELVQVLRGTVERGTLAGLAGPGAAQGAYAEVGLKTGTVRDMEGRPLVGWVVAVDEDVVVVAARAGRMPRQFAEEVARQRERVRGRGGLEAARVQVLGLVAPESVEASCRGAGFVLEGGGPRALSEGFGALRGWVQRGPVVCLGAPWRVRFAGGPQEGRDYAGVLTWSLAPPYVPPPGVAVSEQVRRARRGSDFAFRTTRLQYTAGVVAAEDSELRGEARVALARVVAHNARHGAARHGGGRPVCDTTHCQTFQGTVRVRAEEERAMRLGPLRWEEWLPFSQGGQEPWREERARSQVESVLGAGLTAVRFEGGQVHYVRVRREGGAIFDEPVSLPCEVLRSALRLPACPRRASFEGPRVLLEGRGKGHGEGLDVESAKASGLPQERMLEQAYGGKAGRK